MYLYHHCLSLPLEHKAPTKLLQTSLSCASQVNSFQVFPASLISLSIVLLQSPGSQWPASSSLSRWCQSQCSMWMPVSVHSQDVSQPLPSSFLDFHDDAVNSCPSAHFFIGYPLLPVYPLNSSQASSLKSSDSTFDFVVSPPSF